MANVFKPKRSNTASSVPTTSDLIDGELAVNSADQKIYIRDGSSILEIGDVSPWKTSGYTGIGTTSTVGIGTRIDIIPYDTQDSGTLSFEGSAGQLFSISNNLTSGSIFSVNDVSGIPSIDVDADGTIQLAPITSTEFVGIGTTNPQYKLHVVGNTNIDGTFTVNGAAVGISSVSEDTAPQLGGTLQTNGNLIDFGDSSSATDDRLRFGQGNDLQIWHNGANSYISQSSDVGDLYITSLNDDNDVIIQTDDGSGNTTDYFRADGSTGEAKLFHYGSEKIKTISTGVSVTGIITGANSVASSENGLRKITASTSTPSGGSDGDIWIKYTA